MVTGDQMEEHALHEVAQPAPIRIGSAKIAVQQPHGEFLKQLLGGLGIAEGPAEIPADRSSVAIEQPLLSRLDGLCGSLMRLPPDRPERGDLAQPLVPRLASPALLRVGPA